MSELKPCPFCGGSADLVAYDGDEYMVQCSVCIGAAGQGYGSQSSSWTDATKDEAITAWNTRAVPDVPELVRYDFGKYNMINAADGYWTPYHQAAEIIAAKDAEISKWKQIAAYETDVAQAAIDGCKAAEAKLAQYEAQINVLIEENSNL